MALSTSTKIDCPLTNLTNPTSLLHLPFQYCVWKKCSQEIIIYLMMLHPHRTHWRCSPLVEFGLPLQFCFLLPWYLIVSSESFGYSLYYWASLGSPHTGELVRKTELYFYPSIHLSVCPSIHVRCNIATCSNLSVDSNITNNVDDGVELRVCERLGKS